MCVCVFVSFILNFRLVGVPAGATKEEGHIGFLIYLLSAVLALIFFSRKIQLFFPSSTVKSNLVYYGHSLWETETTVKNKNEISVAKYL